MGPNSLMAVYLGPLGKLLIKGSHREFEIRLGSFTVAWNVLDASVGLGIGFAATVGFRSEV